MTKRKSGILLHPTSLPSAYGIGDLGQAAYTFVDKLAQAKQTLWQILPLVPTDSGGSPYASCSAFAGNPLLISPELLMQEGYLTKEALEQAKIVPSARVDYAKAAAAKQPLLHQAYEAFLAAPPPQDYQDFLDENEAWLEDYALYIALKRYFYAERAAQEDEEGFAAYAAAYADSSADREQLLAYYRQASWHSFPAGLKKRNLNSLRKWRKTLVKAVEEEIFLQYIFQKQWLALKAYANERGIRIIGDAPIFVAYDSADVWANQRLFQLDAYGIPTGVAGVPPDYFSKTGQLWGNPLYDWKRQEKTDFAWWTSRIAHALRQVDMLRIDHFRGFAAYWEVPFGAEDAIGGRWVKGPGEGLFRAIEQKLGRLPLIAEDLGILTDDVIALRDCLGFPGMCILQFAFGQDKNNAYLPHCCAKNSVIYTGTHDNDTTRGWYAAASEQERDHFRRYMNVDGQNAAWDMIRLAFSSPADTAIIPLQDVLNLPTAYRMNIPGTADGNWGFCFSFAQWEEGFTAGLRYLSELFGRNEEL